MEELSKRVQYLEEIAKKSGMESKAKLNIAFEYVEDKYGKELSNYAKEFAIVMISYLNAYKTLGTGIVKANIETSKTQDATKFLFKLLGYAPVVGDIFGYISEAIDFVFEKFNESNFEKKQENIMKVINALSGWDPDTINKHIGWASIHLVIWYNERIAGCSGKEHAAKMIGYFGKIGEYVQENSFAKDADYDWTFKEGCNYMNVEDYPGFSITCINGLWNLKKFKALEFNNI